MSILQSGFGASSEGYEIEKSLRFRASGSAYLSRTPAAASNRKTWTWSGWVKRGAIVNGALFSAYAGPGEILFASFPNDQLQLYGLTAGGNTVTVSVTTTALFRDPSAHYHILVSLDTTQAVSTNRVKLYANGVLLNATYSTSPGLNADLYVNSTAPHRIANYLTGDRHFDGYLSEVHFIDGQALGPEEFGEFDPVTGVWVPKEYTGTYGANGFHLPFDDGTSLSALTADASGNGNNWAANNISLTAGASYDWMDDTPTNNFATLNPLDSAVAPINANLSYSSSITSSNTPSSIEMPSGKWYWEYTLTSGSNLMMVGIARNGISSSAVGFQDARGYYYYGTGEKYNNAAGAAYGASFTINDVVGVAFDATSGALEFYKNGVSQGVAFTGLTQGDYTASLGNGSGVAMAGAINFGQRPFAYTPPAGFKALNTANAAPITPISSGSFTGNANANGPFVWLGGTPASMTINGNAVTFGTHADRLANGIKLRTSSASYNASGSNTLNVASFVDDFTDPNRAKVNP